MAATSDRASAGRSDVRCDCGNMLARRTADRIEIKCRRCKRVVTIPLAPDGRWSTSGRSPPLPNADTDDPS